MAFIQALVLLSWGVAALAIFFGWHKGHIVKPAQMLLAAITVTLPFGILNLIPMEGGQVWPHAFLPEQSATWLSALKHLFVAIIVTALVLIATTLLVVGVHAKCKKQTLIESFDWLHRAPWHTYYVCVVLMGLTWSMVLNGLYWWPHMLEKVDGTFWWWLPFMLLTFFTAVFPVIGVHNDEEDALL